MRCISDEERIEFLLRHVLKNDKIWRLLDETRHEMEKITEIRRRFGINEMNDRYVR